MKDLMVDIETLGTGTNALIIQIGSCYFDRLTGRIGDKFCQNISIQDSLDKGFLIDGSTLEFWFRQPNHSFLVEPLSVETVLNNFSKFARLAEYVWAHATFDFPVLANAYSKLHMKLPFHYRITRDIRTLVDLSGIGVPKLLPEKTHNALDDCLYQVSYCVKCFEKLEGKDR